MHACTLSRTCVTKVFYITLTEKLQERVSAYIIYEVQATQEPEKIRLKIGIGTAGGTVQCGKAFATQAQ